LFYNVASAVEGTMLWRHGDVLIAAVRTMPTGARPRPGPVLVHGELTGHSHRLADPEAGRLWEGGGSLWLEVVAPAAAILHQEHRRLTLPRGLYRVWTQREYAPEQIRRVVD
jgi:hypothetical protein